MKQVLIIAGAAAFAFAGPAYAKPGNGHGNGHGYGHGDPVGYGVNGPVGYGAGGCPPGLAKKNPPCLPPGQAKKLYGVGQRLPLGYGSPYAYNQIPYDIRSRYGLPVNGNYYYGNGYLYRVDPKTMLIQQALAAALMR